MKVIFDTGGTKTRVGISKDGHTIDDLIVFPTKPTDFTSALDDIVSAAQNLRDKHNLTDPVSAVAAGIPSPLNKEKSVILAAPNLPDWRGRPLKTMLEEKFQAPTYLENDTVMIGIGEAQEGSGQGHEIVVYLTVSTGFGGARIIDGRPDRNVFGFEPGHQVIDKDGPICGCGNIGHLEAIVSGSGLERTHNQKPEAITDPAVWQQAASDLAIGLHNVLVFWSPDIIVIGGSVMNSIDLKSVAAQVVANSKIFNEIPPIVAAKLGDQAGLIGALAHIKNQS